MSARPRQSPGTRAFSIPSGTQNRCAGTWPAPRLRRVRSDQRPSGKWLVPRQPGCAGPSLPGQDGVAQRERPCPVVQVRARRSGAVRCAGGSVIPLRREICVDGRADPLFRSVTELVASEGFHSWLGMPVCNGDTARGNPLPVLGQHHHLPGRPRSRGPGSGPTPSASTFRATRPSRRLPHRHRSEIPLPPRSHVAHGRRFDLHMLRRTRAAPGFGAYPGRRRGGPSPALLVLGNVNTSSAGSM